MENIHFIKTHHLHFKCLLMWCVLNEIPTDINYLLRLGIFLFTTVSRLVLGPTQTPNQWVPETLFLEIKRLGREASHSPPSSAEVKNTWSYSSSTPSWRQIGRYMCVCVCVEAAYVSVVLTLHKLVYTFKFRSIYGPHHFCSPL